MTVTDTTLAAVDLIISEVVEASDEGRDWDAEAERYEEERDWAALCEG